MNLESYEFVLNFFMKNGVLSGVDISTERINAFLARVLGQGKKFWYFLKIRRTISKTAEPMLGLFVLI